MGMEAIRTFKTNPYLVIGTHHIPTWTTPLLLIFAVAVLMPGTSLLGHLCGVAMGYFGKLQPFETYLDVRANLSVQPGSDTSNISLPLSGHSDGPNLASTFSPFYPTMSA